ncbi:hypothetical protein C1645_815758 [Glomus cerebriforme]|uniref:Uncharacterized protein n=1 Tax=Glomus cerebriforme TaxID=658196 RepID=A0A397TMQ9_9GLOM|nr:hypothetical protein C1645_815758 [Glomus cerebriforme]
MQARAHEKYPPKDEINYNEICNDTKMQRALLILFPPTPLNDWECPSECCIINRLNIIDLEEAFHLFEHRLNEIGDILMDSFQEIHIIELSPAEGDAPEILHLVLLTLCSEFCNKRVPFKIPYLQLADNDEIIKTFFG